MKTFSSPVIPENGRSTPLLQEIEVFHPQSGKKVETLPVTPISELPSIIEKSKKAQMAWSKIPLAHRSHYLMKVVTILSKESEAYAEKISYYNGKLKEEALIAEIFPTLNSFRFFAKKGKKALSPKNVFLTAVPFAKSQVTYKPMGVVGIIAPWNYPFMLALQDVPAALMAGNSVIIKPSEYSAKIGQLIEELLRKAELPQDLVQCVYGYGDLGAALISSGIQKICFIGSTKTGQKVHQLAAQNMIPCTLELGGKDAAIVLEDADLQQTVRGITWAGLTNCGQTCASVELVYIPRSRKGEFLQEFQNYLKGLPEDNFGSMNTLIQSKIVQTQLREAIELGANVHAQKDLVKSDPQNPFKVNPTILTDVPAQATLLTEETFGPILPLIFYDDLKEVLSTVNQSPYGLTTSVWTKDFDKGMELASEIDSGVVTINDHMITPGFAESPWLGHKKSGLGFSHSEMSLINFSKMQYVYHDRGLLAYKFWQYPFSQEKGQWILKFLASLHDPQISKRLYYTLTTLPKLLLNRL